MKFRKEKTEHDIKFNGTVTKFILDDPDNRFEVVASSMGVLICGQSPIFETPGDYEPFAKALGDAMKEVDVYRKHLRSTLLIPNHE